VIAAYLVSLLASSAVAFASARAQELAERAALLVGTLPRFWLGLMLVLVFHDGLGWLPASHAAPALGNAQGAWIAHLVLPVTCLALPAGATLFRLQVAALREGLASGVARQSHLAGLTRGRIVYRDGIRPLFGFLVTLLALDLPALVSGALVVEVVFAWPGMGRVVADALLGGDYPLALGGTMLIAFTVVVSNLLADIARSYLDPRQQVAAAGEAGA
jgi:peptide/nickel transport system permease protein